GQYDASFRVGNGSNGYLSSIVQIQNNYYLAGSFSGFDQRTDNISNLTKIDLNGKIDTMPISPFRPPHLLDTIKYYPRFNGGFNAAVNDIYNHNGKILAVGNFRFHINRIYGKPNFMETRDSIILDSTEIRTVALLNLDGTLDKTFRFAGEKALSGANGNVSSYYHDSGPLKGKLVIFGAFKTFDGQPYGHIVRLNADGTIDNTFNVGGEGANVNINGVTYNEVTKQYTVVGQFVTFNGVTSPRMVLLNSDGKVDNNFKVKDFGRGSPGYAKQLDDGLIAVSGGFREYGGIVRQNFMIIDSEGDLVPGMNNSGELRGYVYKIIESKSDDGKRALLLLGGFSKFNNIDARNITRLIIE
ncbi:MAG: delta-60 repeat domain-containing protein, partial [Sphingobacterium sp.]